MLTKDHQPILKDKLAKYLAEDADFAAVYNHVREAFNNSNLTAHNWEHSFRDLCNAIVIGEAEHANMRIVLPAITMHDIGFLYGATSKSHGAVGAEKLAAFLEDVSVTYTDDERIRIADCIRTHRGSKFGEVPETLEAKVVTDADMLEKLGPVGIYQVIRSYTEFDIGLREAIERMQKFPTITLETATGRQLAEDGRQYASEFARQLADAAVAYPPVREDE